MAKVETLSSPDQLALDNQKEKLMAKLSEERRLQISEIDLDDLKKRQNDQEPPPEHEKAAVVAEPYENGVSGDNWGVRSTSRGTVLVTLEDHRNHGVEGALYREMAHGNSEAITKADSPTEYISALHSSMAENLEGKITVPAAAFEINSGDKTIEYVGQGTPLVILNLKTKQVKVIDTKNAGPVGMPLNPNFRNGKVPQSETLSYNEGDIFLTGSDAMWEWLEGDTASPQESYKQLPVFLSKFVQEGNFSSVQELTEGLRQSIHDSGKLKDDLTLIGLQL